MIWIGMLIAVILILVLLTTFFVVIHGEFDDTCKVEYIKFKDAPKTWQDRCSGDGYEKHKNKDGESVYSDINIAVGDLGYRPCAKCGKYPNENGDDACISNLGKVMNACCGHGKNEGYIQFENGITIRGFFKVTQAKLLNSHKEGNEND